MSITRLEKSKNTTHRATGWWVRVKRGDKVHSKLFSDSTFGSKKVAKYAALKFQQHLLNTLPEAYEMFGELEFVTKRNKIGIGKIYVCENSVKTYWINEIGETERTSFSMKKYGSLALTLAVLSFENKQRIEGTTIEIHNEIQSKYAFKLKEHL